MTDRLNPGQSLTFPAQWLASPKGEVRLMRGSGSLVLDFKGGAYWTAPGTLGVTGLAMSTDGNVTAHDAAGRVLWSTNTKGGPKSTLALQDDWNLVIYPSISGGRPLWSANPNGFKKTGQGLDLGQFADDAVKTAGHEIQGGLHIAAGAVNVAGKALSSVPVVGGLLHGLYVIAFPYADLLLVANDVADGARLDKAALAGLSREVQAYKAVGPYAAMVVSYIPGVGQGLAAGITCGLALANGQPISEAMAAAVVSTLPGQPFSSMAANAAIAIYDKKSPSDVAISVLPIPDTAKHIVSAAIDIGISAAKGQNIDTALLNEADKQLASANLPPAMKAGLTAGLAVAHGKSLQSALVGAITSPAVIGALVSAGAASIPGDALKTATVGLLPAVAKQGFDIGAGVMGKVITKKEFTTIRDSLGADALQGFDAAVALHVGRSTTGAAQTTAALGKLSQNPAAVAAYVATRGAAGAAPALKNGIQSSLKTPATAPAVLLAQRDEGSPVAVFLAIAAALGIVYILKK